MAKPTAVTWYQVYCGFMAALYVLTFLFGVGMLVASQAMNPAHLNQEEKLQLIFSGVVCTAMGLSLAAVFLATFFLPRKPWAWIYHLVLICLGMSNVCCLPATIPLLINWLKPETKEYFGMQA